MPHTVKIANAPMNAHGVPAAKATSSANLRNTAVMAWRPSCNCKWVRALRGFDHEFFRLYQS
jgi:hypothetical protein